MSRAQGTVLCVGIVLSPVPISYCSEIRVRKCCSRYTENRPLCTFIHGVVLYEVTKLEEYNPNPKYEYDPFAVPGERLQSFPIKTHLFDIDWSRLFIFFEFKFDFKVNRMPIGFHGGKPFIDNTNVAFS